jgi:DNA-binding MarR family transcriptional regulator
MDLVRTLNGLQREFGRRLSPQLQEQHGLDLRMFFIIKRIEGGHAYPGELARTMLETPSQMTRQIDKLQHLGFVERRLDADDSRRIRIELTDKARALLEQLNAELVALLGPALASLDPAARQAIIGGVGQLSDQLRIARGG